MYCNYHPYLSTTWNERMGKVGFRRKRRGDRNEKWYQKRLMRTTYELVRVFRCILYMCIQALKWWRAENVPPGYFVLLK